MGEKMQLTAFLFCCKGQVNSVYFCFIDINRKKSKRAKDDRLITGME